MRRVKRSLARVGHYEASAPHNAYSKQGVQARSDRRFLCDLFFL
jgi:hypothetical protein